MRVSLRAILIGLSLVVLVLPVAGVQLTRLYESALVRQTESSLIAQGAFIAAFYRAAILTEGTQDWEGMTREVDLGPQPEGGWVPHPPTLDLSDSPILPPFPDPQPATSSKTSNAHPYAVRLGTRLNPVLKDAQLTTLAGIRVVDPWGVVVASTGEDLGLSIAAGEEVASALRGEPASRIREKVDIPEVGSWDSLSRTSHIRVFVTLPITLHDRLVGAVLLSRTPPSIMQALYAKRWLLGQAFALLLLIVLAMTIITHRLIARPISRLVLRSEQIAAGEPNATRRLRQHKPPRIVELARLQQALSHMATKLEERASYLRDFTRHLSHEFKTPIASIRAVVELMQDHHDMPEDKRQHFLNNVQADTDRLQQLTTRLNQLTQADLAASQLKSLRLKDFFNGSVFKTSPCSIAVQIDPEVEVEADAEALTAAMELILDNAVVHGAQTITISCQLQDGSVAVDIANDGEPISPGNQDKIFDPFFTTKRDDGGSGLGLNIASALLAKSGAAITLASNDPVIFRISF